MQQPKPKELRAAFVQLAKALNKVVGDGPGEWNIEFTGGGWRIKTQDAKGKHYYPLGNNSFAAREFLVALFFSSQVLTVYETSRATIMGGNSSL